MLSEGLTLTPVVRRFALQAGARELLRGVQLAGEQVWSGVRSDRKYHRVCHCLRRVQDADRGAEVLYDGGHQRAFYANLQTCASPWACPPCSAKITERRRGEVQTAIDAARSEGLRVVLVTMTVQHFAFETCGEVLGLLKKARKRMTGTKMAKINRERFGVVGFIKSLEVTYGANGWHPHYHELLFLEPGYDLGQLRASLAAVWSDAVTFAGGRALSLQHGLDAVDCDEKIAAYVAKFGREPDWQADRELTKAPSKMGKRAGQYTPLQLLNSFTFSEDLPGVDSFRCGEVWREYALAFQGSHQLQWSRGLKARWGIGELSDEEIEGEKVSNAVLLASIPLAEWRNICAREERGRVLAAASTGDMSALQDTLDELAGGALLSELEAAEKAEHGWHVSAKTDRQVSDRSVCWRVDRLLDAAIVFGWRTGEEHKEARERALRLARESLSHVERIKRDAGTVPFRS